MTTEEIIDVLENQNKDLGNNNVKEEKFTEIQKKLISLGMFDDLIKGFKETIKNEDSNIDKKLKKIDFYKLLTSSDFLILIDNDEQDVFDLKVYEIAKIVYNEIKNENLDEIIIKSFLKDENCKLFLVRAILNKDFELVEFYQNKCQDTEIKNYEHLLSNALKLEDTEINCYLIKNFDFKNKGKEFNVLCNTVFQLGSIEQINELLEYDLDFGIEDVLHTLQEANDFNMFKDIYFSNKDRITGKFLYENLGQVKFKNFNIPQFLLIANVLLLDEDLETSILNKIITNIFEVSMLSYGNEKIVKDEKTQSMMLNVFELVFKHKNYKKEKCFIDIDKSQPNGDFLYSLLLFIGSNQRKVKSHDLDFYGKIVDKYFENIDTNNYLEGPDYHIIGSTLILLTNIINSDFDERRSEILSFTSKIFNQFPEYLNKPNPNGKLPIELLNSKTNKREKEISDLLIKHGAVEKVPNNFWNAILKTIKKENKEAKLQIQENKVENIPNKNNTNNLSQIKTNLKKDFIDLQNYINKEQIDPIIKIKCENLFLSSNKLINIITKIEQKSFSEELFFLEKNISSYLKDSISAYYKLEILNNVEEEKLNKAKNMCITHIDLLLDQVNLVKENILSSLTEEQLLNLKVQDKFLEKKFKNGKM